MSFFNKLIILLVVLFTVLWEAPCAISSRNQIGEQFIIPFQKTHVVVYNFLEGLNNFTIHCMSKDDDLGSHVIGPEDNYDWGFRSNIWGTTLFFCGLSCPYGSGTFDLYKAERDRERCLVCVWHVTKDGIYGYDGSHTLDVEYKWPKPVY